MFDAERLLGGLLQSGLSGNLNPANLGNQLGRQAGLGSGGAALGMGLLGVALAAFEHYSSNNAGQQPVAASAPPPPPAPGGRPMAPPPPPPMTTRPPRIGSDEAILLIRAMIAAAAADGEIDAQERARIIDRLQGIGDEERQFLEQEMQAPASVYQLAAQCRDKTQASGVYQAALLAIEVDSTAEQVWLQDLAAALGLSQAEINALQG